jgi:hypothetical protein
MISAIKGKGLSSTSNFYSNYDEQPIVGTNFYRIKEIDNDGKFIYSKIVSANYQKVDFKILPNPVSNQIHIESGMSIEKIEILNAVGQIMKTFLGSKRTLDLQSLSNGVYYVKSYIKDNQFVIKKFSKL